VRGTVRLLVDYDGVLGPNRPDSDATLHPLALSRCNAVELNDQGWQVVRFGQTGEKTVLASGSRPGGETVEVRLDRKPGGEISLSLDDRTLWTGELPPRRSSGVRPSSGAAASDSHSTSESSRAPLSADVVAPGDGRTPELAHSAVLGIEVEPHSHLVVEQFAVQGKPHPAVINYLFTEAILGAGGSGKDWQELRGPEFHYRLAARSKAPGARVKWNVEGHQFTLWSPRGPEFGKAQVKVDGRVLANLDLHAERLTPSQPAWKSPRLKDSPHAIVLTATEGMLVVDSIEATR
jgi:hypothetical protein